MASPILYFSPDTGDIRGDVFAHAVPLADCALGVRAPVLVRCQFHGQYEVVASVVKAPSVPGYGHLLAFGRVLLAAVCGECRAFHERVRDLTEETYRARLDAIEAAVQPLASYTVLEALLHTPLPEALRALAAMPLPQTARRVRFTGSAAILDRATGSIVPSPSAAASRSELIHLAQGDHWLVTPCRTHGWDSLGPFTCDIGQPPTAVLRGLGRVLLGQACTSCEEFHARETLLRIPAFPSPQRITPLSYLRYCHDAAEAIVRVTQDVGWVVGEQMARLVDFLGPS
jgi:hypothetical protein